MYTQTINLNAGINLISFFINTPNIINNINYLTTISTLNNNSIYSSIVLNNNVIGSLQTIINGYGYFLTCSNASTIHLQSNNIPTTVIGLNQGMNLIGFPCNITKSIAEVFGNNIGKLKTISTLFNNTIQSSIQINNMIIGNLNSLTPNYAYYVEVNEPFNITIEPELIQIK